MSVLKWKERQKEGEQLRIITKIQMIDRDGGSEYSEKGVHLLA